MVNRALRAVLLLLLASSCGGGSPTAPATPAAPTPAPTPPPVLAFIDGLTDAPLTPRSLVPASPKVGDSLRIELDGYVTREQVWTGQRIELWPLPQRQDQQLAYKALVYDGEESHLLTRWAGPRFNATLAPLRPEWAGREAEIRERLSGVFADIAGAGGPAFSWTASELSYPELTVKVDPEYEALQPDYAAVTRYWTNGSAITKVELAFASPDYAATDSLSMHMMGYAIGLNDWDQPQSVMYPGWSRRVGTFHELERAALHMMYQHRVGGNAYPDRAPGFVAAGLPRSGMHREPRP